MDPSPAERSDAGEVDRERSERDGGAVRIKEGARRWRKTMSTFEPAAKRRPTLAAPLRHLASRDATSPGLLRSPGEGLSIARTHDTPRPMPITPTNVASASSAPCVTPPQLRWWILRERDVWTPPRRSEATRGRWIVSVASETEGPSGSRTVHGAGERRFRRSSLLRNAVRRSRRPSVISLREMPPPPACFAVPGRSCPSRERTACQADAHHANERRVDIVPAV